MQTWTKKESATAPETGFGALLHLLWPLVLAFGVGLALVFIPVQVTLTLFVVSVFAGIVLALTHQHRS